MSKEFTDAWNAHQVSGPCGKEYLAVQQCFKDNKDKPGMEHKPDHRYGRPDEFRGEWTDGLIRVCCGQDLAYQHCVAAHPKYYEDDWEHISSKLENHIREEHAHQSKQEE